jgi:SAM-dependent methyltransferase
VGAEETETKDGRPLNAEGRPMSPEELVTRSIAKYRWNYWRYERVHPEIFNPVEQRRLRQALGDAVAALAKPAAEVRALDVGCGTGNVTRHLIDLGVRVVAADVSPHFLRLVRRRFGSSGRLDTVLLNGQDLAGVEDGSFDLTCAYSVLHHVPDYLAMVDEMARVVRPGGLVFLDHEANQNFWDKSSCFWQLLRAAEDHRRSRRGPWNPLRWPWQRYLQPSKYYRRVRRWINPSYPWDVEGDIHVWEFDHVEWGLVEERLGAEGCEIVSREDYLGYSSEYPDPVWERFKGGCTNMRLVVARRA